MAPAGNISELSTSNRISHILLVYTYLLCRQVNLVSVSITNQIVVFAKRQYARNTTTSWHRKYCLWHLSKWCAYPTHAQEICSQTCTLQGTKTNHTLNQVSLYSKAVPRLTDHKNFFLMLTCRSQTMGLFSLTVILRCKNTVQIGPTAGYQILNFMWAFSIRLCNANPKAMKSINLQCMPDALF